MANLRLLQKGKAPLKSATTAFNRSRPRSLRALQAKKRHIGKGLFCFKKPPKAEDCSNENTRYIPKGTCEQHKNVVLLTKKARRIQIVFHEECRRQSVYTTNLKILTSAHIQQQKGSPL